MGLDVAMPASQAADVEDRTPEELQVLQKTARIIGIWFSVFLEFASAGPQQVGISAQPQEHQLHAVTEIEWSIDDLACFQRAARIIKIPFHDLIRYAERSKTAQLRLRPLAVPLQLAQPSSLASGLHKAPLVPSQDEASFLSPPSSIVAGEQVASEAVPNTNISETSEESANIYPLSLIDGHAPTEAESPPVQETPSSGNHCDTFEEYLSWPDGQHSPPTSQTTPPVETPSLNLQSRDESLPETTVAPSELMGMSDPMIQGEDQDYLLERIQKVDDGTIMGRLNHHNSPSHPPNASITPAELLIDSNFVADATPHSRPLHYAAPTTKIAHLTELIGYGEQSAVVTVPPVAGNKRKHSVDADTSGLDNIKTCFQCSVSHKACKPSTSGGGSCATCRKKSYQMSKLPCVFTVPLVNITLFRTMTDPMSGKPYGKLSIEEQFSEKIQAHSLGCNSPCNSVWSIAIIQEGYEVPLLLGNAKLFDNSKLLAAGSGLTDSHKALFAHPYWLGKDLRETKKACMSFVRGTKTVRGYTRARLNKPDDTLTWTMFGQAFKLAMTPGTRKEHADLIHQTLSLWTAARTMEGGWKFVPPQFLGLVPNDKGRVPLVDAPFIDYQFSAVMVQEVLLPLKQTVLKNLEKLTASSKHLPDNWLVIFLVKFILLNTFTLLIRQQQSFARLRGAKVRYTNPRLINEIHDAAKTLLVNFHYRCKGISPFEVDWKDAKQVGLMQKRVNAKPNSVEAKFFQGLCEIVARLGTQSLKNLVATDAYEQEHWFTGQLFIPRWRPVTVNVINTPLPISSEQLTQAT